MDPNAASDLPSRLRAALVGAGFTYDGVAEVLGTSAHDALARNETTPGLRRTGGGSPVETLVRLFLLQTPVAHSAAEAALPGLVDRMAAEGLVEQSVGEVAARLDVRPYATGDQSGEQGDGDRGGEDLWVVSDLTPGLDGGPQAVGADHVLGISPASTSLAQLTLRDPVGTALDLGTGCGVQALHLARHAHRVVATDVNARALWMTRFNLRLNDLPLLAADAAPDAVGVQVRDGSFFEPVRGERFDLVATNPPFVISPGHGERLVYRDSGLPGDQVVEDIVRAAPDHLTEGGWCQVLANWVISRDIAWADRLGRWVAPGCDAFVVQREVLDPAAYVELWLKDAGRHGGPDYLARYDTWLSWFSEQDVEGIGFGWINLRRRPASATGPGHTTFLDWPYEVEQPVGPAIGEWGAAVATVEGLVADGLAEARLQVRADVRQETVGPVGAEHPETIVLRQQRGLRRARRADTVEAALVGACDGDLAVGQIIDAVAQLLGQHAAETRATYLPVVRELVSEGFLHPAG